MSSRCLLLSIAFAEHGFQPRRAFDVAGLNGVNDVHQYGTRSVAQIQPEQDDDNGGEGEPPCDNIGFIARQVIKGGIGDAEK